MEQQLRKYKAKIQDHRRGLNDVSEDNRSVESE
jgi:ribosome-associated translation inhibitor RaiA